MKKIIVTIILVIIVFCGGISVGNINNIGIAEAASIKVFSGKGVCLMADSTSKWYNGNAGGVNVFFEHENCGMVNYSFIKGNSGWKYTISSNAPDYARASSIVDAVLKYIRTGQTTITYDPS